MFRFNRFRTRRILLALELGKRGFLPTAIELIQRIYLPQSKHTWARPCPQPSTLPSTGPGTPGAVPLQ